MKAWQELVSDPNISICDTLDSQWYINYGVKIQRFNDGTIEVHDTMTNSDHYRKVTPTEYLIFMLNGWQAGCTSINASLVLRKAKHAKKLYDNCIERNRTARAEALLESYEKLMNNYYELEFKLNNILSLQSK
jgi:hypothetical protein